MGTAHRRLPDQTLMPETHDLPAGRFSTWLGQVGVDVPCGTCTACCTSSQFVHIGPDERDTLSHIPKALLFPAPGLPKGNVVMGYDERGHCPMFVDGACSIYEHRPRTCRTYDCRVFPAAGLEPDHDGRAEIAAQVRRWRFDVPEPDDATAAGRGPFRGRLPAGERQGVAGPRAEQLDPTRLPRRRHP